MSNKLIKIFNVDKINKLINDVKFDTPKHKNVVLFTNGNAWYIDSLIFNLLRSKDKHERERKLAVFCTDKEGYEKCKMLNFSNYEIVDIPDLNISKCTKNTKYSTDDYTRLCFVKIVLIKHILDLGYIPLYIDPDMAFKKPSVDDLLSYLDDNNFVSSGNSNHITSNIMIAKPNDFSKNLFTLTNQDVESIVKHPEHVGDEDFLTKKMKPGDYKWVSEIKYPQGNSVRKYKNNAHMIHANFVSGLNNKIKLMQDSDAWFIDNINMMYLIHYTKLVERRVEMEKQLKNNKISDFIPINWLTNFDRENITPEQIRKYIKCDCNHSGIIANFIAHIHAIKDVADNKEMGLIVEDDLVFVDNFYTKLQSYMTKLPTDWEIIFMGHGLGIKDLPKFTPPRVTDNRLFYRWDTARTASCYLINKKGAKKIMRYAIPMVKQGNRVGIDHHLEEIIQKHNIKSYLLIPPLGWEGSQTRTFDSSMGWINGSLPESDKTIVTKFTIFGERSSGVDFLEKSVSDNFDLDLTWGYGDKHFFGFNKYNNSDNTLFIGIVRNAEDWMNDFFQDPLYLPEELTKNQQSFLNNSWWSVNQHKVGRNNRKLEMKTDRTMKGGRRYINIFGMRNSKNKYLLGMKKRVKNFIIIKYEDLLNDYDNVLKNLQTSFNLHKNDKDNAKFINNYKHPDKKDFVLNRQFIKQKLDLDTERLIGYII